MIPLMILTASLCLFNSLNALEYVIVDYQDEAFPPEQINVRYFEGVPYFNISELNKVFNAFISIDAIDRRLFLDIYDQRLIFLLDSPYLLHDHDVYNLIHKMESFRGRKYLPLLFLQRISSMIFPDKLHFDSGNNTLYAVVPTDHSFSTIVIDPGHGGRDPGAVGISGSVYEKEVALSVAKKVRTIIENNLDVQVLLTREDDRFLPLKQRTAFANKHDADLFISLHANAAPNRHAQGVEVYFLSAARTDEARAVEIMENSVVEKYEGGKEAVQMYDDLTFILMDMAQAEHLRESSYFALQLQAHMVKHTGAVDRGVKQAGFYVLRGAFMPAVLVELGFLSNAQEEKRLAQKEYQQKLAAAIYEGVKSYINNYGMFR